MGKAVRQQVHGFTGRGNTGQQRDIAGLGGFDQLRRGAGADQERGAGFDGFLQVVRSDDGSRANHGVFRQRIDHGANRIERHRGTQGDFEYLQAAVVQCLSQRYRIFQALHDHHGNDRSHLNNFIDT